MINAKDIFTIEREMLIEAQLLLNGTDLSHDEREEILYSLGDLTESQWDELNKRLIDKQINPLDRLKNGEFVNMGQINAAVRRATKNE